MRSIQKSLIAGTVVAAVASIAIGGALIYIGARVNLMRQFDEELQEDAEMLASAIHVTPEGMELGFDELDMKDFAPNGGSYLEVWTGDAVLYRSPGLGGDNLAWDAGAAQGPSIGWTRVASDARVRSTHLVFRPRDDPEDGPRPADSTGSSAVPEVRLELARGTTDVDNLLARLRVLLGSAGLLAGLVAALVIATVVRRTLRPLDDLATEISQLNDGELSATVALSSTPREIEAVVDQLNAMLRRLEAAFIREKTFSADIAHELRTPMAGLRSTLEVALSRQRTAGEYRGTLDELMEIVERVQSMVETLLYLSRLEAGQIQTEKHVVDLDELLRTAWQTVREDADRRSLTVVWSVHSDVLALTDPLLLEVALRNIFDNAVSYANTGGRVGVSLAVEQGCPAIRISNTGSSVAQERIAELMERFTRADPSRRAAEPHAGLGLALVGKITAILDGSLDIRSSAGGEFAVTLALPKLVSPEVPSAEQA
jgi:two-component system, OmpR family, heavy metal sensor histidine kinase CusS